MLDLALFSTLPQLLYAPGAEPDLPRYLGRYSGLLSRIVFGLVRCVINLFVPANKNPVDNSPRGFISLLLNESL